MKTKKLSNDASESIGAIIYQFYIALDKCFELNPDESLYIEKFGDVSNSTEQIEVKEYSDSLTDAHLNFWNTINNWLNVGFDHQKYKSLILLTTQSYGPKTKFSKWNELGVNDRLSILEEIKSAGAMRYQSALEKDKDAKKSESYKLMEKVLEPNQLQRLKDILPKIFIADSTPCPNDYYEGIKNRYLKGIPSSNKDIVMKSMLGLLTSPEITEVSFEIKEGDFSKQFQDITAQYNSTTIIFPKKHLNISIEEAEKEMHLNEEYVKKILEIEYEEVIPDAITHYIIMTRTISEELMDRLSNKEIYEAYHQEIINQIKPKYSTASRNATEDTLIRNSKNHYDDIMQLPSPALGTFNDTHIIFKNGTIHMLANDEKYGINWKLKLEK